MRYKAIVIIGGSQKTNDRVFKALSKVYRSVFNAKFSNFNKNAVADLLQVSFAWLNDKYWRADELPYGVTPQEMVDALGVYAEHNESYQQKMEQSTFDSIPDDRFPVFTDIESECLLKKVFDKFSITGTVVFFLDGDDHNAVELHPLSCYADVFVDSGTSDGSLVKLIADFCAISPTPTKPTLHLYDKGLDIRKLRSCLPVYEPLQPMVEKLKETAKGYSLGEEVVPALFKIIYTETPPEKLELSDVTEECCMTYESEQHESLVPRLREKANILFHTTSGDFIAYSTMETFRREEIKTHE